MSSNVHLHYAKYWDFLLFPGRIVAYCVVRSFSVYHRRLFLVSCGMEASRTMVVHRRHLPHAKKDDFNEIIYLKHSPRQYKTV